MKFYEKRDNSRLGKLKRWMRPKSHIVPSQFEDSFLTSGNYYRRDPDTLSHMRMLRTWVVANAPKNKLDMRRIQEVHVLNNEIYYQMYKRFWKRAVIFPVVFVFCWKILTPYFMESSGQHDYADSANYAQNPPFNHY